MEVLQLVKSFGSKLSAFGMVDNGKLSLPLSRAPSSCFPEWFEGCEECESVVKNAVNLVDESVVKNAKRMVEDQETLQVEEQLSFKGEEQLLALLLLVFLWNCLYSL